MVWWLSRAARGRLLLALSAVGPFAAALWGLQLGLMATLGFASPWAALALIGVAGGVGLGVGWWIRSEPTNDKPMIETGTSE